jgi:hypothetical protein
MHHSQPPAPAPAKASAASPTLASFIASMVHPIAAIGLLGTFVYETEYDFPAILALLGSFTSNPRDSLTPRLAVTVWVGWIVAFVAYGSIWLRAWWSYGNARATVSASTVRPGFVKVACVLGGTCLLITAIADLAQTPLIYRVVLARQSFDKYTVTVDVPSRIISVEGLIGPRISQKINDALNSHYRIDSISITSPGGLLDEALEAASVIEHRNHLAVVAHKQCDSACIIVLMSGAKRFADWDLNFGFHSLSLIPSLESLDEASLKAFIREVNGYLVTRGVPQEIIDQTPISAKRYNRVSAIKLVEAGALTALLDGDKIISTKVAKWFNVERAVGQASDGDALAAVLFSIRSSSPDVVDREADRLYTALEAKDATAFRGAISSLARAVGEAAIDAADPEATFAYLEATLRQLRYLSRSELWSTCARYVDGRGISVLTDASNRELFALSELIRSAGASGWTRRLIPSWAEKQALEIFAVLPNGEMDSTSLESNPRVKCLWMTEVMNQVQQLGAVRGVAAFRWMMTQDKKR